MKAMIFAAGLGTRLKPFTEHHPKALVEVAGVPMLQRVIENIKSAGVSRAVVNVHHFASQIVDFLKANDNFGMEIAISDETDLLLDTGGGLLHARKALESLGDPDEPILLHNADVLTDIPLNGMLADFETSRRDALLLCSHRKSSRVLWFDRADGSLAGWENISTGQCKPAGFTPSPDCDPSPFGGVHIIRPGSVFPLLEEYAASLHSAATEAAPGASVPFSIVPFYLAEIGRLDIGRHMLPEACRWFDVGSAEKLAAAESALSGKI